MTYEPAPNFLRVLAIAVQSFLQTRPHRPISYEDVAPHIRVWDVTTESWDGNVYRARYSLKTLFERVSSRVSDDGEVVMTWDRKNGSWSASADYYCLSDMQKRARVVDSQQSAEWYAASLYTFPYPIARVSDAAVEIAERLYEARKDWPYA